MCGWFLFNRLATEKMRTSLSRISFSTPTLGTIDRFRRFAGFLPFQALLKRCSDRWNFCHDNHMERAMILYGHNGSKLPRSGAEKHEKSKPNCSWFWYLIYRRITSEVTLAPTDLTKYPALHSSSPQSCSSTCGNSLNTTLANILFIICTIWDGKYRGGAVKKGEHDPRLLP